MEKTKVPFWEGKTNANFVSVPPTSNTALLKVNGPIFQGKCTLALQEEI